MLLKCLSESWSYSTVLQWRHVRISYLKRKREKMQLVRKNDRLNVVLVNRLCLKTLWICLSSNSCSYFKYTDVNPCLRQSYADWCLTLYCIIQYRIGSDMSLINTMLDSFPSSSIHSLARRELLSPAVKIAIVLKHVMTFEPLML